MMAEKEKANEEEEEGNRRNEKKNGERKGEETEKMVFCCAGFWSAELRGKVSCETDNAEF